ncbi:HypC/HybG/HupF family hydrogenase formation chaperone [Marinobacterium sp. D7]|uniref:HypC/HybG/HupF family hydrogenase formation chaperone n=1 Tax=Marinobacterium ramblicola TaxID=2849041 RepID=UPI001C2D7E80|nr:HypC/HybG/HupF family hydrogenase formation chaperone [Marinobacterium ramblicola]MBV1790147.1 HypC/HybG/HupF family hydrogenase formation chaperone [Marinobacterium ramblicola]
MCIGIPMQVAAVEGARAFCTVGDEQHWIDIRLIDTPSAGEWLLVFLGAAREKISAERAVQVAQALAALDAGARGDSAAIDALFADLVERTPQLPPHLQSGLNGRLKEDNGR